MARHSADSRSPAAHVAGDALSASEGLRLGGDSLPGTTPAEDAPRHRRESESAELSGGSFSAGPSPTKGIPLSDDEVAGVVACLPLSHHPGALPPPRRAQSVRAAGRPATARRLRRFEEMRGAFGLPLDEEFVDDFMCALKKRILLQGRMYVFAQHVCFHANIFGYEKLKTIPLRDVTSVRRAKNLIFPNSIEIVVHGKREFFTSFISREDAFREIVGRWLRCSNYAKLYLGPEIAAEYFRASEEGDDIGGAPPRAARRVSLPGGDNAPPAAHYSVTLPTHTTAHTPSPASARALALSAAHSAHPLSRVPPRSGGGAGSGVGNPSGSAVVAGGMAGASGLCDPLSADETPPLTAPGETPTKPGSPDPEQADAHGEPQWWLLDSAAPGASVVPPKEYTTIGTATLPCNVTSFLPSFFDDAAFEGRFRTANEHTDLRVSEWTRMPFGYARDISFRAPVKSPIGPKSTLCNQSQRFCYFSNRRHAVIETSQVNVDVPYGEYFTVDTRWDIEAAPSAQDGQEAAQGCLLTISLGIPFNRRTVWKSRIEKATTDEMGESIALWIGLAKQSLRPPPPPLRHITSRTNLELEEAHSEPNLDLLSNLPPKYAEQIRRMLKLPSMSRGRSPSAEAQTKHVRQRSLENFKATVGAVPQSMRQALVSAVRAVVAPLVGAPLLALLVALMAIAVVLLLRPWLRAHWAMLSQSMWLPPVIVEFGAGNAEARLEARYATELRRLLKEASAVRHQLVMLDAQVATLRRTARDAGIKLAAG